MISSTQLEVQPDIEVEAIIRIKTYLPKEMLEFLSKPALINEVNRMTTFASLIKDGPSISGIAFNHL